MGRHYSEMKKPSASYILKPVLRGGWEYFIFVFNHTGIFI
jgi:hypothetical protein